MFNVDSILVTRHLRDYYNDIQEVMAAWFAEDITTSELENSLDVLDEEYAALIIKDIGGKK